MTRPPDFSLVLTWDNGSVPPRYRKSGRLEIDASGRFVRTRRKGYDGDERVEARGRVDLGSLAGRLLALGLFETEWNEVEHGPVGGGGETLSVTLDGQSAVVPRYVEPHLREAKDALVEAVREAV